MAIPVQNLYYLLCYAWDCLEERDKIEVGEEASPDVLDLLGRVLDSGLSYCVRRGFDRNYVQRSVELRGLRGRVDFATTLKRNGFDRGELTCELDDFTPDILHNQIIKATLGRLLGCDLDRGLKGRLRAHRLRLSEVSDIRISSSDFGRVVLHCNNAFYRFLHNACELIHRHTIPREGGGGYSFSHFEGDDAAMGHLFEEFIRNFIKRETRREVAREQIRWRWESESDDAMALLPRMMTDICVRGGVQKILIECKFGLVTHANYGAEKLRSKHLYQLHAYLSNLPDSEENIDCRGILLYPSAGMDMRHIYTHAQRPIEIRTLNLHQDWPLIRAELLALVEGDEAR